MLGNVIIDDKLMLSQGVLFKGMCGRISSFAYVMLKVELTENKYFTWIEETNLEYDLMLGDDSDSLFSCNLLEEFTNGLWEINYFYSFENFYRANKTGNPTIGIDMAFTKNVRCFDNHLSQQYPSNKINPFCVNLNQYRGITVQNYCYKFPFSTLMLIMSIYDIPMPKNDIGKEIILAVDSSFKGFYTKSSFFKKIYTDWLELLGFTSLIDVLEKRSISYFKELQDYFNLNEKIIIDDNGYLKTDIDFKGIQPYLDWHIGISDHKFKLVKHCIRDGHALGNKEIPDRSQLISLAYTSKNYVSYTYQE